MANAETPPSELALLQTREKPRQVSAQAYQLGLGVVTDASGRAVDVRGAPSPWLFTLGARRRPHLWETTAVPDIVRQAAALAELLHDSRSGYIA